MAKIVLFSDKTFGLDGGWSDGSCVFCCQTRDEDVHGCLDSTRGPRDEGIPAMVLCGGSIPPAGQKDILLCIRLWMEICV